MMAQKEWGRSSPRPQVRVLCVCDLFVKVTIAAVTLSAVLNGGSEGVGAIKSTPTGACVCVYVRDLVIN